MTESLRLHLNLSSSVFMYLLLEKIVNVFVTESLGGARRK